MSEATRRGGWERGLPVVAVTASVAGAVAVTTAAAWYAIGGTSTNSEWRKLLGTLGDVSIPTTVAALLLGVTALATSPVRARLRVALVAAVGFVLGLAAAAFWAWAAAGILRTT